MSDKAKRLREVADGDVREMARAALIGDIGPSDHAELCRYADEMDAAATEIDALAARLAAAEEDRDRLRNHAREVEAEAIALGEENGRKVLALKAENARLRNAAAALVMVLDHHFPSFISPAEKAARLELRAALTPAEGSAG